MVLFVSEICRLILGFLEEEMLFNTYNTLLKESKHLEECRIYINNGIQFSTSIHGKNLKKYLASDCCIDWSEAATQTDITNSLTSSFAQTDQASVNANPLFETTSDLLNKLRRDQTLNIDSFTNVNELPAAVTTSSTVASTSMSKRIRKRKRSSVLKNKQSNVLTTPTKNEKEFISESESTSSCAESDDLNDSLLEIDFFINNLCKNDFAEKLAQSINRVNVKKQLTSNVDEVQPAADLLEVNHVNNLNPIETETIQMSQTNEPRMESDDGIFNLNYDLISNKFSIGNEDICYLAECFSEPAYATLYETIKTNNVEEKLTESMDESNEVMNEIAEESNEPQEQSPKSKYSISKNGKSMIVIAKSLNEIEQIEKKIKFTQTESLTIENDINSANLVEPSCSQATEASVILLDLTNAVSPAISLKSQSRNNVKMDSSLNASCLNSSYSAPPSPSIPTVFTVPNQPLPTTKQSEIETSLNSSSDSSFIELSPHNAKQNLSKQLNNEAITTNEIEISLSALNEKSTVSKNNKCGKTKRKREYFDDFYDKIRVDLEETKINEQSNSSKQL